MEHVGIRAQREIGVWWVVRCGQEGIQDRRRFVGDWKTVIGIYIGQFMFSIIRNFWDLAS